MTTWRRSETPLRKENLKPRLQPPWTYQQLPQKMAQRSLLSSSQKRLPSSRGAMTCASGAPSVALVCIMLLQTAPS